MGDCVFCNIIKGSAPASIAYFDEKVMAIMDVQPVNLGHVLIIPKIHVAQLSELSEETGVRMFKIAMRIAEALRQSGTKCEGINLFLADGEAAGQDIFHVHLHVIPRFRGDGFQIRFGPNYGSRPEREELDRIGEKIREAIH
jgi:histidine triad (HIT) family protein